jgi:hypothetical protein
MKRQLIAALLLIIALPVQAGWITNEIANLPNTAYRIKVADVRGDGQPRVYCGVRDGDIYELTWQRGGWLIQTIGTVPGIAFDLCVAAGRGDGLRRVYVPCQDGHVYEFSNNREGWTRLDMGGNAAADADQVAFGCGRNDGVMRGYATMDDGHIWEFTWSDRAWRAQDIGRFDTQMVDIALGSATAGPTRVCASSQAGALYELVWTGRTWHTKLIDRLGQPGAPWGIELGSVAGSDLPVTEASATIDRRGPDLYVTSEAHAAVFRYAPTRRGWHKSVIGRAGFAGADICLGQGRGDGVVRVYQCSKDAHVYEFSAVGGRWRVIDIGGAEQGGMGVAVGAGRGDGVNRVYACYPDGRIMELTFESVETASSSADRTQGSIEGLTISPNPFAVRATISCRASGPARAVVVDAGGRQIRTLKFCAPGQSGQHWSWDACDNSGRAVPAGCYIVLVTTPTGTARAAVTVKRR